MLVVPIRRGLLLVGVVGACKVLNQSLTEYRLGHVRLLLHCLNIEVAVHHQADDDAKKVASRQTCYRVALHVLSPLAFNRELTMLLLVIQANSC